VASSATNIKEKLKLRNFKLNTLLDVTNGINSNLSKKKLLGIFHDILTNELRIGKAVLFIYDKKWNRELNYGVDDEKVDIQVKRDLMELERITVLNTHPNERLTNFDVVVPIHHNGAPLAFLLLGDLVGEKIEVSPIIKHLPFIQTLTNVITVALENKRLQAESLRQAALKRELELASKMQSMLIPNELPHNEKLDVAAFYQPHQEVGGDYYDFVQISEDEIAFCMADVSGKGVSAAILMSNFQGNIRALMETSMSLEDMVATLNERILASAKGEKFITLFIARYSIKTRKLIYINAGHNPPLLATKSGIKELQNGCTILGMFDQLPSVNAGMEMLPEEAVVVSYTDGVTEIENNEGEQFGMERLADAITLNGSKSMEVMLGAIFQNIETHRGKMNTVDDIALLGCRFH
jgi:sigma-B regulation protein RsbU (phosphoserine phosphatase)